MLKVKPNALLYESNGSFFSCRFADSPSNHGAAIGGTLGVLLLLALLVGAFWWWRRRRQTRLRIVRLYDDEEVLMRNDGYQPVSNQEDNNQII